MNNISKDVTLALHEVNATMAEMTRGDPVIGLTTAGIYAAMIFRCAGFKKKDFLGAMEDAWENYKKREKKRK